MVKCRACGKEITFVPTYTGKIIPLEKVLVYELEWDKTESKHVAEVIYRNTYILHFLTCKPNKEEVT